MNMKKISSKIKKFRKPLLVGVVLGIIIALFQGLLIYAAGVFNLVGTYGSGHTL